MASSTNTMMHGGDPLLRRGQFCLLRARQTRNQPTVDAILPAPAVDGLLADLEIMRNVGDAAAGLDEIENLLMSDTRIQEPRPRRPRGTPLSGSA